MPFILRHVQSGRKLCQQLSLDALEKAVPRAAIQQALQETHARTRRERKLNLEVIVLLVIAMSLYAKDSVGSVWHKLSHRLRLLQSDPEALPRDSALVYRRYQLGVRPMAALSHRVCRPLATEHTPGAFRFGLRLVALDGQEIDVPDTPENARYFGKRRGNRGTRLGPRRACSIWANAGLMPSLMRACGPARWTRRPLLGACCARSKTECCCSSTAACGASSVSKPCGSVVPTCCAACPPLSSRGASAPSRWLLAGLDRQQPRAAAGEAS